LERDVKDKNKTKRQLIQELEALCQQIVELRRTEKALQREMERAQGYLDIAGVMLIVIDTEGKVTLINRRACEMLGYGEEEVIGKSALDTFVPQEDRDRIRETIMRVFRGDIASPTYIDNVSVLPKGGEQRIIAWHVTPLKNEVGEITSALGLGEDVTERERAQQQLEDSRELLRNLTEHLQSTREEEKKRIAREIHDDLGHALAILRMDLSWLRKRLSEDQGILLDKVDSMSDSIAVAIQKVKTICAGLRPGLLDDIGLTAAIEWQAGEVQQLTGIKCKVTSNPTEMILDRDRSTVIFRSFQQLLTNVVDHAKATKVDITVTQTSDNITLEVRDNGTGITQKQVSDPKSFGLIGIRERLRFLGGELTISAIGGKGTIAKVTIPLTKRRYFKP
jgi:PAS domain S-box-containing protein